MNALSVGLPGRAKSSVTPFVCPQIEIEVMKEIAAENGRRAGPSRAGGVCAGQVKRKARDGLADIAVVGAAKAKRKKS
jgi:hypothetical protein